MISSTDLIIVGVIYTIITGLVWYFTKEPMNATSLSIGIVVIGIVQKLYEVKEK